MFSGRFVISRRTDRRLLPAAYTVPSNKQEIVEYSEIVERIYSSVGLCKKMDEAHIDAVGGSFGSGVAFVSDRPARDGQGSWG